MSDLEPEVADYMSRKRTQLANVLSSEIPEATDIKLATNEMLREYHGFIGNIACAAAASKEFNYSEKDVAEGIERIAQFAVWRALVNQARNSQKLVLEGDPRLHITVISDGQGGFKLIRPDKDSTKIRNEHHKESDGIQADKGEQNG